jgi:co-chaperonin GroES (HSP10)
MKVRPLGSYVVVLPSDPPQESRGGIYLPEDAVPPQMNYGCVIDIGPEVREVAKGDLVWFNRSAGKRGGGLWIETFRILNEDDLVVVFDSLAVAQHASRA